MTLDVQFMTMAVMSGGGFYLGMALDTFRRLSVYWRERNFMVYLMEISFWLTQTLLLYYILFLTNNGELRFYVFAALLLGFAAYQALAGRIYRQLLEHVIQFAAKCSQIVLRLLQVIIVNPIIFTFQLLLSIILLTSRWIWKLFTFVINVICTPIVWLLRLIYRILPNTIQKKLHKIQTLYSTIKKRSQKWIQHLLSKRR